MSKSYQAKLKAQVRKELDENIHQERIKLMKWAVRDEDRLKEALKVLETIKGDIAGAGTLEEVNKLRHFGVELMNDTLGRNRMGERRNSTFL